MLSTVPTVKATPTRSTFPIRGIVLIRPSSSSLAKHRSIASVQNTDYGAKSKGDDSKTEGSKGSGSVVGTTVGGWYH